MPTSAARPNVIITRDGRPSKPSHIPPPNWPASLPYLPHPLPHSALPRDLASRYCTPAPPPIAHSSPLTRIAKITDPQHPAIGQYGLFAARKIPPRTWILDYTGVVHDQHGTDLTSNYDLCLELLPIPPSADATVSSPAYHDIAVDAARSGNAARFINDFRGVPGTSRPNVEFQSRKVEVSTSKGKVEVVRIGVWSGKEGVAKGDELLLSYGRAFWKARKMEEEQDKEPDQVEDGSISPQDH